LDRSEGRAGGSSHFLGDLTLPTTLHRAKRENGGLGEDLPGSPMTYKQVLSDQFAGVSWGPGHRPGKLRGGHSESFHAKYTSSQDANPLTRVSYKRGGWGGFSLGRNLINTNVHLGSWPRLPGSRPGANIDMQTKLLYTIT
jgi:hypothetical protein